MIFSVLQKPGRRTKGLRDEEIEAKRRFRAAERRDVLALILWK
jgi:hypothetical protein